jgi:hypothetical protein
MNLHDRLHLAGKCLLALLDPDKALMPTGGWEVAHDLGRWWDAVLRLEEATGFAIPAELEAASLRNLDLLTGNPDRLLMNGPDVPWLAEKVRLHAHSLRETLLAFGGLVHRRQSAWAREAGAQLVGAMSRCLQEDGRLDLSRLGSWGSIPSTTDPSQNETRRNGWFDSTATSGRSLEALVWFFETTGHEPALDVARRVAEHHLAYSTSADGNVRSEIVDPANAGHNHSYHGTLRGLLQFGLCTGQRQYVDVVEATYRKAIRGGIVKESGWTPHDLGKTRFPNAYGDPVTDPASTGDATQLALWLALEAGCVDLLDDVERYVRARLFPAQLTEDDAPQGSRETFSPRQIGGWGIHGPSHGGKGCTPDVLAAVTHTLCDVYAHVCTRTQTGLQINLHLDYENADVRIQSERGERGTLTVLVKRPSALTIRVPGWAPEPSLALTVDGEDVPLTRLGSFAWVPGDLVHERSQIVLYYALPHRQTEEQMPSGRRYRFDWRGDEIVGVAPQDHPLPFYPLAEEE